MIQTITSTKKLHHIWIGPKPLPTTWMSSWDALKWDRKLWGNEDVESFGFKNYDSIKYYIEVEQYYGAADLMRYEILYRHGGFLPGADFELISSPEELEELLCCELITVYENERARPGLVSPILGATKNHPFLKILIDTLYDQKPTGVPWKCTGNLFVTDMINKYNPDVNIVPSNYLIGDHFEGASGFGDKFYTKHHWGSTKKLYNS